MQESPSPYDPAPHGTVPSRPPAAGRPIVQKERSFVLGLVLTVVTFGIYPLFYHYLTHDELARQTGKPNGAKGLWIAYIVLFVANFILSFAIPADAFAVDPEDPEALIEPLIAYAPLLALSALIGIAMLVLYVLYVSKQWDLLYDAKRSMGLAMRGSKGRFFLLYLGSLALAVLFFWLLVPLVAPLVMIPIAYFYLNENYNDIAAAVRRAPTGPMAPNAQQAAPPLTWLRTDGPPGSSSPSAYPSTPPPTSPPASQRPPWAEPEPDQTTLVEQSFQCPRCHTYVTARGPEGEEVAIRCARCGEAGQVRMPVV